MVVVRSLKDILSIKIKPRHDSPCDQFSRLLMTKMLIIAAFLMGFDYFSDRIQCTNSSSKMSKDFMHSQCWITGLYIYREIAKFDFVKMGSMRAHPSIYYGIPGDLAKDGIMRIPKSRNYGDGNRFVNLCETKNENAEYCMPMTRVYFLQYQWMPFYMGSLALLYYLPYIMFRLVNVDLLSLKNVLKSVSGDADHIVRNYFNYKINGVRKLRIRIFLNIWVKCTYIFVNLFGFLFTDYLLYNRFRNYGIDYIEWAKASTYESHLHYKFRKPRIIKPGNKLLPSMGICQLEEASKHETGSDENRHIVLCEISTHILYQYVLLVLWFLFCCGIAISVVGLLLALCEQLLRFWCFRRGSPKSLIYRTITMREIEYLEYIKKKDLVMYGEVLRKLKQQRTDLQGKIPPSDFETNESPSTTFLKNGYRVRPSAPSPIEMVSYRLC